MCSFKRCISRTSSFNLVLNHRCSTPTLAHAVLLHLFLSLSFCLVCWHLYGLNAAQNGVSCWSQDQRVIHIHNVVAGEAVKMLVPFWAGVFVWALCVCVCLEGFLFVSRHSCSRQLTETRVQLTGFCPLWHMNTVAVWLNRGQQPTGGRLW